MGWGVGIVYVVSMHESRDLRISKRLKWCLVQVATMDRLVCMVYMPKVMLVALPHRVSYGFNIDKKLLIFGNIWLLCCIRSRLPCKCQVSLRTRRAANRLL
jgi:hypothetical protein